MKQLSDCPVAAAKIEHPRASKEAKGLHLPLQHRPEIEVSTRRLRGVVAEEGQRVSHRPCQYEGDSLFSQYDDSFRAVCPKSPIQDFLQIVVGTSQDTVPAWNAKTEPV